MIAVTDSGLARLFRDALEHMRRFLRAERLMVLYDETGRGDWVLRASEGLREGDTWDTAPVSLDLFERVRQTGLPLLTADAQQEDELRDRTSLILAGIRAVLCVPLRAPDQSIRGLLYADHLIATHAFNNADLMRLTAYARELERRIWVTLDPAIQVEPATETVVVTRKPRPAAAPPAPPERVRGKLTPRAIVVALRCLGSLLAAGIPLTRGLTVLAGDEPVFAQVRARVDQGQTLSVALSPILPAFPIRLLEVGERTGALVEILRRLAEHEEARQAQRLRLQAAVTYPLVLAALCTLLLLVLPPFLLRGQLQLLGADPPFLTRVILFMAKPVVPLTAVLGLLALWKAFPRRQLQRLRLVRVLAASRFADTLALQVEVGIPLIEAVTRAGQVADIPGLEGAVEAIRHGRTLHESMQTTGFFPRSFLVALAAGEESGRVSATLSWLARLYRFELEAALATWTAALEPLLLLVMGIVGCLVALGTVLPTLRLLDSL